MDARRDREVIRQLGPVRGAREQVEDLLAARALRGDPLGGRRVAAAEGATRRGEGVAQPAAGVPETMGRALGDAAGQEDEDESGRNRLGAGVDPGLADAQQLRTAEAHDLAGLAIPEQDLEAVVGAIRVARRSELPPRLPAFGELVPRRLRIRVANLPEAALELLLLVRPRQREIGRALLRADQELDFCEKVVGRKARRVRQRAVLPGGAR